MHARNGRIGAGVAALLGALAIGSSAAAAPAPTGDLVYCAAGLDSHRTLRVAILPVVAVVDNPTAERAVESCWYAYYQGTRIDWVPADEVRARMQEASSEPGNLTGEVEERIWTDGEVGPEVAGRLTTLLGVSAVLSVRIDRCELVDGARGEVAMSAVLTGADGTRLWSISGGAGHGGLPGECGFVTPPSAIPHPTSECCLRAHNVCTAFRHLLARWAWSLPDPLYRAEPADPRPPAVPLLAGNAAR